MITALIHERTRSLKARGFEVSIRWVPAHEGVLGNEEADKAAKEAAHVSSVKEKWTSLTYLKKKVKKDADREEADSLEVQLRIRERKGRPPYSLRKDKKGMHDGLSKSRKALTARFLQLKSGHGSIGQFLHRIKAVDTPDCWGCLFPTQTPEHLWLHYRKWRSERAKLLASLRKENVQFQWDRKGVAELLGTKKAIPHLLEFLKDTDVGYKLGKKERQKKWKKRRNREDEEDDEGPGGGDNKEDEGGSGCGRSSHRLVRSG